LGCFLALQFFVTGAVLNCGFVLQLFLVVFVLKGSILKMQLLVVVHNRADLGFELFNLPEHKIIKYL
jgi:hypothetical protein